MAIKEKLFDEFPGVDTAKWEEIIHRDLKGADYDRKLVWKSLEGFNVQPYYREEHLKNLDYLNGMPGKFPFVRGNNIKNNWLIRQDITVDDVTIANKKARKLIDNGILSLGFVINRDLTTQEFELLLHKINPEEVYINFMSGNRNGWLANIYAQYIYKDSYNSKKIFGSDDFDPFGHMLKHGVSPCGHQDCHCAERFYKLVKEKLPNFRLISVNAKNIHNAGASIVQELGIGLAMGAEYLDKFTDDNIKIEEITPKMQFVFAVGSNYFMEIAKLRAARMLWAKIVDAYKPKDKNYCKTFIHVVTSTWNKTLYDPYVNMLRSTTEAMSAALGGADSITVNPFDSVYKDSDEFSERIARNIQIILKEEAHFDKVSDPAGGSYYIENLTNSIAEKAWELFINIQEKGGFLEAFKEGYIQDIIDETVQKRDMNIAMRKEVILGTNQYPNFAEKADKDLNTDRIFSESTKVGVIGKPLKLYRGAEVFEQLRLRTDRAEFTPKVFLLKAGNLAMRQARAQFAANFFGCAGFDIEDNLGYDKLENGVNDAFKYAANIVVLCSSDEEYELLAPEAYKLLDSNAILVIAGNPACKEKLEEIGIKYFIHVKTNLLESLTMFQKTLGI
ncbi:MAG TPA: acyl-CoA mutase large subunit family protein [Bacteroidales bacterium]|nr:acyl-CoA mutase large subunit family protein [Bacteroidales bacterium]